MTTEELKQLFDKIRDEELGKRNTWVPTYNKRRDINAMLMLEDLYTVGCGKIIAWAEHDEIGFDVDIDELATVITVVQIRELVRCGVSCNDDGLYMNV